MSKSKDSAVKISAPHFTKINVYQLVVLAMLVSIEIVLSRFLSFSVWNMKIGFAFIPIVAAAMLYGPLPAGLAAAAADLLGAVMFPIGAYFPGFTLTAFLTGLVWGMFLHRKQTLPAILAAVGVNQAVGTLFINTLWISILYGTPYLPLFETRLIQAAILFPIQTIVIYLLRIPLKRAFSVLRQQ